MALDLLDPDPLPASTRAINSSCPAICVIASARASPAASSRARHGGR